MMQFNSSLYNSTVKLFPYWRLSSLLSTSVVKPDTSNSSKQDDSTSIQDHKDGTTQNKVLQSNSIQKIIRKSLQTPEALKKLNHQVNTVPSIDDKIQNAKSIEELVCILKNPDITVDHIKQILFLINKDKSNTEAKNYALSKEKQSVVIDNKDIVEILGLSTPSLIKILKNLTINSNRNVPVLKTLTHNITLYSEQLNIKMCSDILYGLAVLNYVDENLLNKIMLDLIEVIPNNNKSSVLGSIATSIGLLRYKNTKVLDIICKWAVDNYSHLRKQDFIAILQCFATLGYNPVYMTDLQQNINSLKEEDMSNELWLDFVWSLTILDKALPSHVSSVLEKKFVTKILTKKKYVSKLLNLLNINGAAQYLIKDYNGPFLNISDERFSLLLPRRQQKQEYVKILEETLTQIAPHCFQTNVYTKMGFYIDAECYLDSNKQFLTLNDSKSAGKRLAIMIQDYHDYSRGEEELLGVVLFHNEILRAKNYHILNLSYHNISISDKLEKRVKFLTEQINLIDNL